MRREGGTAIRRDMHHKPLMRGLSLATDQAALLGGEEVRQKVTLLRLLPTATAARGSNPPIYGRLPDSAAITVACAAQR